MASFLATIFFGIVGLWLKARALFRRGAADKVEAADHAMLEAAVNRPDNNTTIVRLRRGKF